MNAILQPARVERRITRTTSVGPRLPGFAGPGHTAVEIFGPERLTESSPFVLLMDDTLDFAPGQPVGEAHPHAGLETVTFVLEGSLDDPGEGVLDAGDAAWMTAGRGVIHGEGVKARGHSRILQLWLALPARERAAEPELHLTRLADLPIRREPGAEARLYSGRSGAMEAPARNRVPVTMIDFRLGPNASIEQDLPGAYRAFVLVVEGSVSIGDETLTVDEIGWLDPVDAADPIVCLGAGSAGGRALLYAGAPLAETILHRGPFVAGSADELSVQFAAYRAGKFRGIVEVTRQSRRSAGGNANPGA